MNWAVWPGRYPPGDPAGGPGQKKRRGGTFYLPRRNGAVCGSQGSGHGLLGNPRIPDSDQACPMLQPCILGRQTLLVLVLPCPWDRLSPSFPGRRYRARCRRETSRPVDVLDAPAQGQKVSGRLRANGPSGHDVMASFAGPSCRRPRPRCYSASTLCDSILVPHWTLWYPARLGAAEVVDCQAVSHFVREGR